MRSLRRHTRTISTINPSHKLRCLAAGFCWLLLALSLAEPTRAANNIDLRPGLWRISLEMTIPGQGPDMSHAPLSQTLCLTREKMMRLLVPAQSPCQISETSVQAKRMQWKLSCTQAQAQVEGEGILEFAGERLSGKMRTNTKLNGSARSLEITQKMQGEYLGICPSEQKNKAGAASNPSGLKTYETAKP
ncbi:MAG: DUF3617 family protein [Pseudomonadota bacterium]